MVAAIETISSVVYPPPPELDISDQAALAEYVAALPMGAFLLVLIAHAIGSFVAGGVCTLIAKSTWYLGAGLIGCLLTVAGIVNLVTIPHPTWFAVVDWMLYIPPALFRCFMVGRLLLIQPSRAAHKAVVADEESQ